MKTKLLSIAAVAGLLIGSTALVQAQTRGGMGGGPGASGASPGHEMQREGSRGGPGASGFAPGHERGTTGAGDRDRDDEISGDGDRTTGFGGRDRDDRLRDDRDDRMMDNDSRGIDKD
jgi:hypothetical protein